MEDHIGAGQNISRGGSSGVEKLVEVTVDRGDPAIGGQIRGHRLTVNERHPREWPGFASRHLDRACAQQMPG